jgi:hypothetical protein
LFDLRDDYRGRRSVRGSGCFAGVLILTTRESNERQTEQQDRSEQQAMLQATIHGENSFSRVGLLREMTTEIESRNYTKSAGYGRILGSAALPDYWQN